MVGTPDENDEQPPATRITEAKPWGRRRLSVRWLNGVTEDLHRMGISNWKDKTGDTGAWRISLRKAKTNEEL
jgi:hypothetical protein